MGSATAGKFLPLTPHLVESNHAQSAHAGHNIYKIGAQYTVQICYRIGMIFVTKL